MTRDQAVELMLESFNNDNRMMGAGSGMDEAEVEKFIEQSQPSLTYMLSNAYDKLAEKGLISK
jgi:hypothetical protein